jgi:hypothetical protein
MPERLRATVLDQVREGEIGLLATFRTCTFWRPSSRRRGPSSRKGPNDCATARCSRSPPPAMRRPRGSAHGSTPSPDRRTLTAKAESHQRRTFASLSGLTEA